MLPTEMNAIHRLLEPADPGIVIHPGSTREEARAMKKLGLASTVAGALMAALIGFAAPAQAHNHHHDYYWWDQLYPTVVVPHVDTTVHH